MKTFLLGTIACAATALRVGRRGVVGGAATLASSSAFSAAHAWCGDPYPPYAYSLPWYEFKAGAVPMRVVGDSMAEARKKLRPLLVLPSPGLTYEYLENLEGLCVSERRVAFAALSTDAATAAQLGAQAAAALERLEVPSAHVMGHGFGALAALALRAAAPSKVASLVLASPLGSLDDVDPSQRGAMEDGSEPLLASQAAPRSRACVESELSRLRAARLADSPFQRALRTGALPALSAAAAAADGDLLDYGASGVPTLVTRGGAGDVCREATALRLVERLGAPPARLSSFGGSGALAMVDEKAAYLEAVLDFFDTVDGTRSRRAVDNLAAPVLTGYN